MKNLMAILPLLMLVFISYSCEKEEIISEESELTSEETELIDINGEWMGQGYECLSNKLSEKISISHNLESGEVIATKITGDPCVPAGYVTFFGTYKGESSSFNVSWYGGSPENPASDIYDGSVDIINNKKMFVNLYNILTFNKIE